jgi:hypothetical protein
MVFKKRPLKRTFCITRDKIIAGWRELHKEELHSLYSLPNVIMTIKSRRMR